MSSNRSNGSVCWSISRLIAFLPSNVDNWPARSIFGVLFTAVMLAGLAGNISVIYCLFFNPRVKLKVRTVFVLSLALSDIIVDVVALPMTSLQIFIRVWPFGQIMCHSVPFVQAASIFGSSFTFMAIALDRYFLILYPTKQYCVPTVVTASVVIVWLSSLVLASPLAIAMRHIDSFPCIPLCMETGWPSTDNLLAYTIMAFVLQFLLPVFVSGYCYFSIIRLLNRQFQIRKSRELMLEATAKRVKRRRKQTTFMSMAMLVSFICCWLPLNIVNLIPATYKSSESFAVCYLVGMCSTVTNPIVYSWFNADFRNLFSRPCLRTKHNAVNQNEDIELDREPVEGDSVTAM